MGVIGWIVFGLVVGIIAKLVVPVAIRAASS